MSEYVITTDNNSDLPEEYLKDHGVGCMYLSYSMDGKNYTHGNFLPEHEFYEAMRNGSMPTTAQVNPENAKALLEPYLKEGKDILHIAYVSPSLVYMRCRTKNEYKNNTCTGAKEMWYNTLVTGYCTCLGTV